MTTLILLTKIIADSQLNQISNALDFSFKGLEVEAKILGVISQKIKIIMVITTVAEITPIRGPK